jgi:two-component system, sensor histidine kinase YesM
MRRTKSRRIQTTIALALAAVVLATALLMAVLSYSFTQDAVQRTSVELTAELIDQVRTNIDSYISYMKNIAEVVQANEQVQEFLGSGRTDGVDMGGGHPDAALQRQIAGFLHSISRTRDDVYLILVVAPDGRVVAHDETLQLNRSVSPTEARFYRTALEQPARAIVSSSHVQNIVAGEYRWVITLSRTIDGPDGILLGVLLVDLNFSVINDLLNRISLGARGYLFIVNAAGGIVYHPRQELIYSGLEREHVDRVLAGPDGPFTIRDERGERIYTVSSSQTSDWRIVGVNYAAELVPNQAAIHRFYAISTVAFVVVALIVAVLISARLSRPILRLRSSMQAVERGDFDIVIEETGNDEIGDLARDFNIMIAEIKDLMRRNAEEHEQKRRSELLALQNQITPHFLYNTLDSIIWMAEGKQHTNVVTTVAALARLLRLSISRGDELITIHDEIEHIRNYLTIQKLRYRDRLDFVVDVDEEILRLRTPKIILQPLVENAIYHGIKNSSNGGRVTVRGELCGHQIVLSVTDDGVGMGEDQLREILKERHPRAQDGSRVGVRNVHERIQLYFGRKYGLSFHSVHGGGTVVHVRLPVVRSREGSQEAPCQ